MFYLLIGHLYLFFGKVTVKSFVPLPSIAVLKLGHLSYWLDASFLSDICLRIFFSWSLAGLFILLKVSFKEQNICLINSIYILYFIVHTFCVLFKDSLLNPSISQRFLCFSLEILFLGLGFTLRPVIHFELFCLR